MKQKRFFILLFACVVLLSFTGCDIEEVLQEWNNSVSSVLENEESTSTAAESSQLTDDSDDIFEEALEALIKEHGVFQNYQIATIYQPDDEWFDPSGILSATILDFDSDGDEEMLVCISEECDDYDYVGDWYHIRLYMYEAKDGDVFLSDMFPLCAYYQTEDGEVNQNNGISWYPDYWAEEIIAVNALLIDGTYRIMCEDHSMTSVFADGSSQSYWMLEYVDNHFQYVCSYTQTSGSSSDFAYTGYRFENGDCVRSDLYYSEWYNHEGEGTAPLYTYFGQAITSFFNDYGVDLADTVSSFESTIEGYRYLQSILSADNNATLIFEFQNILTDSDWSMGTYQFAASLEREGTLLE